MTVCFLFSLALLCTLFPGSDPALAREQEGRAPTTDLAPSVHLLTQSQSEISFAIAIPWQQVSTETVKVNGQTFTRLSLPDWAHSEEAGEPQLPQAEVALGVPFGAELSVEVVPGDSTSIRLASPVIPSEITEAAWDWSSLGQETPSLPEAVSHQAPSAPIYTSDANYPGLLAAVANVGVIRQQRVAGIAVYPIQYRPQSGILTVYHSLIVHVRFALGQGAGESVAAPQPESPAYEQVLRDTLLNYESARRWRQRPANLPAAAPWTPPVPGYKISVKQTGIYRLGYPELLNAGLPVSSLDPRTFQLFDLGDEVAIYVQGEDDGQFDPVDYILFYGQAVHFKYTLNNTYWLTFGSAQGRRMTSRNVAPGAGSTPASYRVQKHLEENLRYAPRLSGTEDLERYTWDYLYPPSRPSWSYTFPLSSLSTDAVSATLELRLYAYIDDALNPDHHVQISINGIVAGEEWWDGTGWHTFSASFPQSYLTEGANTVSVVSLIDTGVALDVLDVDWLDLDFDRLFETENDILSFTYPEPGTWKYEIPGFASDQILVFDISEPAGVERLTGGEIVPAGPTFTLRLTDSIAGATDYWAATNATLLTASSIVLDTPSTLQAVTNGADYVIITHSAFQPQILSLAGHRAGQGLRVSTVDVQDIYDEFGYGLAGARAIHDFLAFALQNWQAPAPSYVLLVGDGHYDPNNYLKLNKAWFIPPYLAPVDPWITETASDNRYVTLTAGDTFPDMIVGRLPVQSASDTTAAVTKITAYEANPGASWHEKMLLVADNADNAGDFAQISDRVRDCCLPTPYEANRVYYLITHGTPAQTRAAIIASINDGRLLVNYVGHAAATAWASESLFRVADVSTLANGAKQPIMLPMTCYDGFFHYPMIGTESLGESIVRVAGKGAIASWSPSGLGIVTGHDYLDRGFLDAVFKDGARVLGEAVLAGKLRLWATGSNLDLIDTYLLFGDPGLHIDVLDTDMQVAKTVQPADQLIPGDPVTYTLTFTNAGPAMAFGVTLSDALPAELVNPVVVDASPEVLEATPGITFAWTISDLMPGASGWVRVRAEVGPLAQSQTIVNRAEIMSNIPDTNPANNAAEAASNLYLPTADLRITKTVLPAGRLEPGDVATYTLSFVNAGPDVAHGAILTDLIPPELVDAEVVYASPWVISQTPNITFAWQLADLPAGAGGLVQVRAIVGPLAQSLTITNEAQIAATTVDPNTTNNSGSVSSYLYLPNADLQIEKTALPAGQLRPGDTLTYTLQFHNAGPDAAYGVVLTDIIPDLLFTPTVIYVDPQVITQTPGMTFAWQLADLPPGSSGQITVRAVVSPSAEPGQVIINQAEIAARTVDFLTANNHADKTVGVQVPDLAIVKTGPEFTSFNQAITYRLEWANLGLTPADKVLITDTLPAWVDYADDSSGWIHTEPAPGVIVWEVQPDPGPPGITGTFVLTGWVNMDPDMGGVLVNQSRIAAESLDGEPNNNTSEWTTALQLPNLAIRKAGPLQVAAQSEIQYTLSYSNTGDAAAAGVLITDVLPAGVTYMGDESGLPHSEPAPGVHVWHVLPGPLLPGDRQSFDVYVQAGSYDQIGASLHNAVVIGAGLPDNNWGDNSAEWTSTVMQPELGIALQGPGEALTASTVTYAISYTNAGAGPAWGGVITDVLPVGLGFVSDDSGLPHSEPEPGVHVWQMMPEPVPGGGSGAFHLVARLGTPEETGPTATNLVWIGSDSPDTVPGNNTAQWAMAVTWPDLIALVTGPDQAESGSVITYTLAYSNTGTGPGVAAIITNVLPLGVSYESDDSGLAHSEPQPGVHVWQLAPNPFPSGSRGAFHLVARLGTIGETGVLLVNHTRIGSRTPELLTGNNSGLWYTYIPKQRIYLPLVQKASP